MAQANWFTEWFNSPFYHTLYTEKQEEHTGFVSDLLRRLNLAAGCRVLDTACGKGRICKIISKKQLDVTGADLSPVSIAHAKKLETENLHFFIHDMRLPFLINYFDIAFNLFTSFGYYRTKREHDDAIRTMAAGLKPGGILVLDYLNTHYAEEHLLRDEIKKIDSTTFDIHRWDDETHFYKRIKTTDPSLDAPVEYTEKIFKFSLGDFTDMFSYQSLQVEEVFGDYRFSSYDVHKTPRLILIARKKKTDAEDKKKRLYSDGRTTDALT